MTLTISLPLETESRLRERALAAGLEPADYAQALLTRELDVPLNRADAAEPIARAVDDVGANDEEFTSAVVESLAAVRRDRRRPR